MLLHPITANIPASATFVAVARKRDGAIHVAGCKHLDRIEDDRYVGHTSEATVERFIEVLEGDGGRYDPICLPGQVTFTRPSCTQEA